MRIKINYKLICIIAFLPLFTMCSTNINIRYEEYKAIRPKWLKNELLTGYDAKQDKYSIIIFTSGFDNDNTLIVNGKDTIYNKKLNSDKSMGLARGFRIENTKTLKIEVNKDKINLKKEKENIRNFKFIYLRKNWDTEKKPYTISYSKTPRNFQ